MPKPFNLAMIQMRVEGGDKECNLHHAGQLIAEAAGLGADAILLPEAMDLGWTHPSARTGAEPIPDGRPCRQLADLAQEHGLYMCAGLTERAGEATYNAAVLLDPAGRPLLLHRKLNELNIGHDLYAQGDRLNVCQTEFGTFGLMICADGFAHDHVPGRALGYMGADVILSPCAWAVPPGHDNATEPYGKTWREDYGRVAREFAIWIAGASNVGPIRWGPWKGFNCIGCSLVMGPDGEAVTQGPYGADAETILLVKVVPRPRPARGCDWEQYWRQKNDGR